MPNAGSAPPFVGALRSGVIMCSSLAERRGRLAGRGLFRYHFHGRGTEAHQSSLLDVTIIHGDGTTTAAKKGGDNIGFNGHKSSRQNRKGIFNRGMVSNINANPRGRKSAKRGRKPLFNADIFKERFDTIERVFGWEDKFRRLLLRFERLSQLRYGFTTLAYTMINLRHIC
jgi:hypothetical protein